MDASRWIVALALALVASSLAAADREPFGSWPIDQPGDTVASKAMFDMFETGDGDLLYGSGYRNLARDFELRAVALAVPIDTDDIRMRV